MAGKKRFLTARHLLRVRTERPAPKACWPWTGCVGNHGYGVANYDGRYILAHRTAYETFVGPIPDGLNVLHKCDNRRCCNPQHLFVGTNGDNMADKVQKKRHRFGEGVVGHKLSVDDVRAIRAASGPYQDIAARFGVYQSVVSRIKNGKAWKQVK